jgi:hypothetical protein
MRVKGLAYIDSGKIKTYLRFTVTAGTKIDWYGNGKAVTAMGGFSGAPLWRTYVLDDSTGNPAITAMLDARSNNSAVSLAYMSVNADGSARVGANAGLWNTFSAAYNKSYVTYRMKEIQFDTAAIVKIQWLLPDSSSNYHAYTIVEGTYHSPRLIDKILDDGTFNAAVSRQLSVLNSDGSKGLALFGVTAAGTIFGSGRPPQNPNGTFSPFFSFQYDTANFYIGNAIAARLNGAGFTLYQGAYKGNGSGIGHIVGDSITTGAIGDARLSSNIPLKNGNNNWAGTNWFQGANLFTATAAFASRVELSTQVTFPDNSSWTNASVLDTANQFAINVITGVVDTIKLPSIANNNEGLLRIFKKRGYSGSIILKAKSPDKIDDGASGTTPGSSYTWGNTNNNSALIIVSASRFNGSTYDYYWMILNTVY